MWLKHCMGHLGWSVSYGPFKPTKEY
ncbi:hypothetical protein XFF7767_270002 [Xanthomonas citri pv. fuscans]|uniref:Uncharacterized protein n=1 Tax=Xanthomonas campestris pv. phaseoli TaxID=317013 RepID=A0ABY1TM67_XANCH|nr:hypothetical protein XAP6984_120001 [Xanthomonas phaseoli pv. phaseoli]SOO04646.1 hypothetical protein XFF7767_270002 [Xanthomonas citri pv. fuscans]SOO16843.1 hypothetical protein XFF7766_90002 [Xanthomonas citri pv. fuscans]